MDRMCNSVIRKRCDVVQDVTTSHALSSHEPHRSVPQIEKGRIERRLTIQIYEARVNGQPGKGRPRRTYSNQIQDVLEKDQVKSTSNRRACMKTIMKVEEAKGVCQDRSKWTDFVWSNGFPDQIIHWEKGMICMYLCMYV